MKKQPIPNHQSAMRLMAERLVCEGCGVLGSLLEIDSIGHRVVQGGEYFSSPVLVEDGVIASIRDNIPLAPLHNPANLTGIEIARELFPGTPNVAVFDTEFHQTIPKKAFMYPVPMELYRELRVRKYGFHGTSHTYVTRAAVKNGRCVDTTMGLTPLAGLMMGARCSDIDPALHAFLAKNRQMSLADVDDLLNQKSGLTGICGMNDMRDIHEARSNGDEDAQLAFEMFAYRVKGTIGTYMDILGRTDAVVFTAGIGENDEFARASHC